MTQPILQAHEGYRPLPRWTRTAGLVAHRQKEQDERGEVYLGFMGISTYRNSSAPVPTGRITPGLLALVVSKVI